MFSTNARLTLLATFLFAIFFFAPRASASSSGITGYSGKQGSICTSCHSTGTKPTATLSGPTTVTSGSKNTFTFTLTGTTGNAGLDVASTAGTFTAGTGTKVSSGELVHSTPSTAMTWTFSWTAPTVTANTAVTMYAAGVNGYSNGTGTTKVTINVTAPAASAALSLSPSTLSFAYTTGGATPAAQTFAVSSSGSALSYTVSTSATWLSATPTSGTTPGNVSVSVNPSGLAAGTYTGTVSVSASGASNSPQTVSVTLTVTSPPNLTVSPASMSFAYTMGGTTPAAQTFSVGSSGAALSYTTSTSATWLSATASGTTPGTVSVSVNPSGLSAGTYNGTVSVTSAGAANSPQQVSVTLTVASAGSSALVLSPTSLAFSYTIGASAPAAKTVAVSSSGSALTYTVGTSGGTWLSASGAGTTPGNVSVSVAPTGLAAGTYTGTVTVSATGASNSPQTVAVTLTVSSAPNLTVSPNNLSFAFTIGGTTPGAQSVSVGSSGAALSYSATSSGGSWLSASGSGTTPGSVSVSVNPSGLAAGTYTGTVSVSASGASNSPQSVAVTLTVSSAPAPPPPSTPPTVSINSPQANSMLAGVIQLTATASDGVVGVSYQVDGVQVGTEAAVAPYSVDWDTSKASNGIHTIIATARDSAGNTAMANVSVQVNNGGLSTGGLMGVAMDSGTKFQVQQNGISTLISCATCWFAGPSDMLTGQVLEVRLRAGTSPSTADVIVLKQQSIDGSITQVGTNQFTLQPSASYLPATITVITGSATNLNGVTPQVGQKVAVRGILLKRSSPSGGPSLIATIVELQ